MNQFSAYRSYIEQRLRAFAAEVARLAAKVARLESMLSQLGAGRGGGGGDSGGGAFYADPGSTVVISDSSETLTVMEILESGDTEVGERTVINRYPDDTIVTARLILIRTRDGAYVVAGQGCPPVEGGG